MSTPLKYSGWAESPTFMSGPSAGLPTKKVPGAELQQYGFAPGVSPGASELNWVLHQATRLVEALEMVAITNWNAEAVAVAGSQVVIGAIKPPAGGSLLVTAKEVVWIPETGDFNQATQYTPFGGAVLTGIVACKNVTTVAAQSRNVLLCLREAGNISGFGARNLMWPRTEDVFTGLGQQFFVSLNNSGTGERHGAWDEVHQVVHVADAEKIVSFGMTPDFAEPFYGTDFDMADNPWGESVGDGVRVRCGGGSAVVFGVANNGAKSYYSRNAGVTWQQGITLGVDLIPPNVTTGQTEYVAHWYSDYAECWYLLVLGVQGTTPLLHCYRSVDNGVTWDFLDTWTDRLRIFKLQPDVPLDVARIGHLACFAFPSQADVIAGNSTMQTGMVVFDEVDLTLRMRSVFGGTPIGVFSADTRLVWARELDEDSFYVATSFSGAKPPPLPR